MADRVISYDFRGKFTNLTAGLTAAGKSVNDLGGKLTALDSNGVKLRRGLTSVGDAAGKMGLVAAAGVAGVIAVTARFESAMSRVGAATNATAGELDDLRQAAIDAGASTIFSATEAADGITELGKAGVSTADILSGGLAGALDLAAAGQISVAEAAETTATTLQQFGLEGDQATRVADTLAAGAGKALGSVTDMGNAFKYVGPVAAQMGISLEEASGAVALLASQGILGDQAGTSLRGMLTSLTSPSKVAAEEMQRLGINMYDATGAFIGLDGLAGQLQQTMGGLSEAERNQALGRIFGNEQITAARILYAGGAADVQKWTDAVTDSGYAAEQADELVDNLAGDLEELTGALESALIGAGEGSQGIVRQMTQGLTSAVNAFNDLPPAAKNVTSGFLAITAVTGGAAWFGSKVITGIADTRSALSDLGLSANRTSGSLGRLARTAGGLAALAGAVTILGNALADATGATIDSNNLQRDLEALANGNNSEMLSRIGNDLDIIGQSSGRIVEPLREATTLFGVFGNTPTDNAADNIKQVDQALASMVESGNAEQASTIFEQILADLSGLPVGSSYAKDFVDETISNFGAYETALGNTTSESEGAATATDQLAGSMTEAAAAAQEEADALTEAVEAMREKRDEALAGFDAETRYAQAVKDAAKAAKENGKGINASTEAGQKNRAALSELAGAWNNQSDAVRNNTGRFKEARGTFIDTAVAMGVPREAAKRLAAELLAIPNQKITKVDVQTGDAEARITTIQRRLDGMRDKTVTVRVVTNSVSTGGGRNTAGGITANADGGTVPKSGLPYADRYNYLLADGEEVISNRFGQADRNRGLLKAINAGRLADGGTAGGSRSGGDGGGRLNLNSTAAQLRNLERALKRSEAALERETDQRDTVASLVADLASSVSQRLRSDIFAEREGPSNIWAAGAMPGGTATFASALAGVNADTAKGEEFNALVGILQSKGLDGDALNALLRDGDVATIRDFAGQSAADLDSYEQAFARRESVIAASAQSAGMAAYGAALAAQQAAVDRQTKVVERVEDRLKDVERAIKEADKNNRGGHQGTAAATGQAAMQPARGKRNQVYGLTTRGR